MMNLTSRVRKTSTRKKMYLQPINSMESIRSTQKRQAHSRQTKMRPCSNKMGGHRRSSLRLKIRKNTWSLQKKKLQLIMWKQQLKNKIIKVSLILHTSYLQQVYLTLNHQHSTETCLLPRYQLNLSLKEQIWQK